MISGCQSFLTGMSEGLAESSRNISNCTTYCIQWDHWTPGYKRNVQ